MIRSTGFKRAFLMPSNRRPRACVINDTVRGDSIRSNGVISSYPASYFYSYAISSRYRRYRSEILTTLSVMRYNITVIKLTKGRKQ